MNTESNIGELLQKVRREKPLVHSITNYVTVNDCANILLAIGASPIMADDLGEMEDIVSLASALVLNIGTLNQRTVVSMLAAGQKANQRGIPVILDPVGAGASALRNEATQKILSQVRVSLLRGNLSEIGFVAGLNAAARGVDVSEADVREKAAQAGQIAKRLAEELNCTVAITGATDVLSDGKKIVLVDNGHPIMSRVTGTGCMSTALTGAFCGVTEDCLLAGTTALVCMGIAGEIAYEKAGDIGTGSFRTALMDAISTLDARTVLNRGKVHEA